MRAFEIERKHAFFGGLRKSVSLWLEEVTRGEREGLACRTGPMSPERGALSSASVNKQPLYLQIM